MDSKDFLKVVRKIVDVEARVRERGADEATDLLGAYSASDATALATVLAATATAENDHRVLESQLHAILELSSTGHVRVTDIAHLREIDTTQLPTGLREYIDDLLEG